MHKHAHASCSMCWCTYMIQSPGSSGVRATAPNVVSSAEHTPSHVQHGFPCYLQQYCRTCTAHPSQSKPGPKLATVAGANARHSFSTGSTYTLPPATTLAATLTRLCRLLVRHAAGAEELLGLAVLDEHTATLIPLAAGALPCTVR